MPRKHDLDTHCGGPVHDGVEVLHLEPEQHSIPVRLVGAISDGPMVMLDFKAVQLQDEATIFHQLLILLAAMNPAATQQPLIPPAAGFNIRYTD